MGREEFEVLKTGTFKRKAKRRIGLFIDGVGLDRATRRLDRKVDLQRLVSGITAGLVPEVARYYTLVPNEDDARQFAFLDAVERAGLEVVIKRLPPKGVKRQVSMDVHMATDIMTYCLGGFSGGKIVPKGALVHSESKETPRPLSNVNSAPNDTTSTNGDHAEQPVAEESPIKRLAAVVCPSRELSYAIYTAHLLGTETSLADFGLYGTSDGWKGVDRWIDLSTSETIWR